MILGVGTDIVDIRRIGNSINRFSNKFIRRIYTTSERKEGALVVAIESKRADIYVQAFQCSLKPMCDPRAINPSMLGEWLENAPKPITIVGDAKERATEELVKRGFKNINVGSDDVPKASTLVKMAFQRWNPRVSLAAPSPLYLRQPDAKLPKLEGRLRS